MSENKLINFNQTFRGVLSTLEVFWKENGCAIMVPFDSEMGAATFHPQTIFNVMSNKPASIAFMQPCRRPQDARGGQNPNRLYKHHQFQVILMPSPKNIQSLVLHSLYKCGITPDLHSIDFVENNWSSPSLGANGKGYEVQCNGTEVLQFTYFQQIGGVELDLIPIELAYGLERICLVTQNKQHIYDTVWDVVDNTQILYKAINDPFERGHEVASYPSKTLRNLIEEYSLLCGDLATKGHFFPAYDAFLKMSQIFNLLESGAELNLNDRVSILGKIRHAASLCISIGFPTHKRENHIKDDKHDSHYTEPIEHKYAQLFIEVLCEKLPIIEDLGSRLNESILSIIEKYNHMDKVQTRSYISCQRLVIILDNFPSCLQLKARSIKGPRITAKEAAVEFAKSHHTSLEGLSELDFNGNRFYFFNKEHPKIPLEVEIGDLIKSILVQIKSSESMKWSSDFIQWIRPIRRLVATYDSTSLAFQIGDLYSSSTSLYSLNENEEFTVGSADSYLATLEARQIFLDYNKRKEFVLRQIRSLVQDFSLNQESDRIVEKILQRSESPFIYKASFVEDFDLPKELISTTMTYHQGYIPLFDQEGQIGKTFLVHSDRLLVDSGALLVNQASKSLVARLQETAYFWQKDLSVDFETYLNRLKNYTIHSKLGSVAQQSTRLEFMISTLTDNPDAKLSIPYLNLDLVMDTVFENPELQGIAAGLYGITRCNLSRNIANIIREAGFTNELPSNLTGTGAIVAFILRLDSLVGFFGINEIPTGSSDPLGIRRSAFGLLKLGFFLKRSSFPLKKKLDLSELIDQVIRLYTEQGIPIALNIKEALVSFLRKRLLMLLEKISPDYGRLFVLDYVSWTEMDRLQYFIGNPILNSNKLKQLRETARRLAGLALPKNLSDLGFLDLSDHNLMVKLLTNQTEPELEFLLDLCSSARKFLDEIKIKDLAPEIQKIALNSLGHVQNRLLNYCNLT